VPVAVISGLTLASAARVVSDDIATVRAESIRRAACRMAQPTRLHYTPRGYTVGS